eukprot:TRINITY_DN6295_c0_g1_i1.p1 TRINITY_DN6295_c0_g1~~TRINITY_DN6295_c0_g1_i1.p1  ORF type:complete len:676 (-),score=53.02 TRINITY_DN6295_c0_g1_i1:11-2038(-)
MRVHQFVSRSWPRSLLRLGLLMCIFSAVTAIQSRDRQILSWVVGNFSGSVLPQTWDPSTLDSACSTWKGIYCDAEESVEVITLEQALNGEGPRTVQYQSTIPAALGLFPKLSYLNLRRGGWIGRIPPQIFTPVLERLELAGNNLTGPLPREVANARRLISLGLNDNMITSLPIAELRQRLNESLVDLALERNPLDCSSFFDELLDVQGSPSRYFACDKSYLMFNPDSQGRICGSSKWSVESAFPGCPLRPWVSGIDASDLALFNISLPSVLVVVRGTRLTFYPRNLLGDVETSQYLAWDFYGLEVYSGRYLEDEAPLRRFDSVLRVSESSYKVLATLHQFNASSNVSLRVGIAEDASVGGVAVSVEAEGLQMPQTARPSTMREFGITMQLMMRAPIADNRNPVSCRVVSYADSLLTGTSTGCESSMFKLSWDPSPSGQIMNFRTPKTAFTLHTPTVFSRPGNQYSVPFERDDPRFFLIPDGSVDLFSGTRVAPSPIYSSLQDQALAYLLELKGEFSESFSWSTRFQAQVFGEAVANRTIIVQENVAPVDAPEKPPSEPHQSTVGVVDVGALSPGSLALIAVGVSALAVITLASLVFLIRRRTRNHGIDHQKSSPPPAGADSKKSSAQEAATSFSSKLSESVVASPKLMLEVPGPGSARARKSLTTKTNSPRVAVK